MSFLDQVCVLILTANEEHNLGRTLDALKAFPRIVVLDSGSTDATRAIASRYPRVAFHVRAFDSHAAQWNHGLAACDIHEPWVLTLDADYALEEHLVDEIAALSPPDAVSGYRAEFRYCSGGRPLSGTLYPPQVVLFRRERGRYMQSGHTQRLLLEGDVRRLSARIRHDDRKPHARWLAAQQRYAALEAAYLLEAPRAAVGRVGRLRLLGWPAPVMVFVYALLVKRCIFDGRAGLVYALQRLTAEAMIALEVNERRAQAGTKKRRA